MNTHDDREYWNHEGRLIQEATHVLSRLGFYTSITRKDPESMTRHFTLNQIMNAEYHLRSAIEELQQGKGG